MKRARKTKRPSSSPTTAPAGSGATTLVVPAAAPRNPFVAHAHRRRAGVHGGGARTRRQAEKQETRKLLED